jgi:hypothetical protein
MCELPRREIEDLIARYNLEGNLRDIYVEGSRDKTLMDWFLAEQGIRDVTVYEINTVEIPWEEAEAFACEWDETYEDGNKGRVIAFAKKLSKELTNPGAVTCIVDRDFDGMLKKSYSVSTLLQTDYSCAEMYLFNEKVMNKLLSLGIQGFPLSAKEVIDRLESVLKELFLIRLANIVLGLNMKWLNPSKCLSIHDKKTLRFDTGKFINQYLIARGQSKHVTDLKTTVEDYRKSLHKDSRYNIQGHDFIFLLTWFLQKIKPNARRTEEVVEGMLLTSIEANSLKKEPLFRTLTKRVRTS